MTNSTEATGRIRADATERSGDDPTGAAATERARLDERLAAVERALTETDRPPADIAERAAAADEREALGDRLAALESRVTELEAAVQAVRGYAGAIRAVNREVEQRADLALARATAARTEAVETSAEPSDEELPDEAALAAAVPGDAPSTVREPEESDADQPKHAEGRDERGGTPEAADPTGGPLERLRDAL
ncbi:MAG: hypothetical protein A07HR67_00449 [uncultured archaeon A07HR67]|nr:MAG: hypothetical protein A07HR67_00449 [uncultured archaeon A07HR67]